VSTCPTCNAEVIKATCSGQAVYLSPRKYARGQIAARQEDGGEWIAHPLLGASLSQPLAEGESRYSIHKCPGRDGALDDVRKAESAKAAKQRTDRGKYRPRHRGLRAGGFQITPRGEHR
jgi:hypothetical protein